MNKKLLSGLTALIVLLSNTAAPCVSDGSFLKGSASADNLSEAPFSGECGATNSLLTWTLDASGTLTIAGYGEMLDYSESSDNTLPWEGLEEDIQKIIIQNGVTKLTHQAFSGCTCLTEVLIPKTLKLIEGNPFNDCESLCSIQISEENPYFALKDGSLIDQEKARLICCLKNAEGNYTIPDGICTIAPYAFSYCKGLTSISIPDTVTEIGDLTFLNCSGLTTLALPDGISKLPEKPFKGCQSLTEVKLPANITAIPDSAFLKCQKLEKIVIPNSVTSIGGSAFSGCSSLKEIELPETVEQIGAYAFSQCSALNEIALPKNLTAISSGVFSLCGNLKEITIPEGVTVIEQRALYGCAKLTELTIPKTVDAVEAHAMDECNSLNKITVLNPRCVLHMDSSTFPESAELFGYNGSTAEQYALSYYRNFTALSDSPAAEDHGECGSEGSNLTWVLDAKGTLTISGSGMMTDYTELNPAPWHSEEVRDKIQKVYIQDNVTGIGSRAFADCANLAEIRIPESLSAIGENAFSHCGLLSRIQLSANNRAFTKKNDALMNFKETELIRYTGNGSSYTIPKSTVKICAGAFSGCPTVEQITIPDAVKSIEKAAFQDCSKLNSISVPDGVKAIAADSFAGCESLQTITLPSSVSEIGERAFSGCNQMTKAVLSDSIQTIEKHAFENCGKLETLNLPAVLTSLEERVFANCGSLKSIVIPVQVTGIGKSAFESCTSLTAVKIPKNVTVIAESAFFHCTALTEIVIPKNVSEIGNHAFDQCDSIASVRILNPKCNLNMQSAIRLFPTNAVILGYENSSAYEYALKHEMKFEAIQYIEEYSRTLKSREVLTIQTDEAISGVDTSDRGIAAAAIASNRYAVMIEALAPGSCDIVINLKTGEQIAIKVIVEAEATTTTTPATTIGTTTTTSTTPTTTTSTTTTTVSTTPVSSVHTTSSSVIESTTPATTTSAVSVSEHTVIQTTAVETSSKTTSAETTLQTEASSSVVSTETTPYETTTSEITTTSVFTTEAVTTEPAFVKGKDDWGVKNITNSIGRRRGNLSGFFPYLTDADKTKLLDGLSEIEIEKLNKVLNERAQGFCYGLSVMSVLQAQGIFSPSDLLEKAASLYDINNEDVKKNDNLASAINYYQLLQYTKGITQQMRATEHLSEPDKINLLTSSLDQGKPTLVGYHYSKNDKNHGHAVVAYEIDRNIPKKVITVKNKEFEFDAEIKVYNSSAQKPNQYNEADSIFLNTKDMNWCILCTNNPEEYDEEVIMPRAKYNEGVLCLITSDVDILNYHGLYNGTDTLEFNHDDVYYASFRMIPIGDKEPKMIQDEGSNGLFDETIAKIQPTFSNLGDDESEVEYRSWSMDTEYGYQLTLDAPHSVTAEMEYRNCLLSVNTDSCTNVRMDPDAMIELDDEKGNYAFRMVMEKELRSTRWYDLRVSGKDSGTLSLKRVDNGWILSGDVLDSVTITANDFEKDTSVTFSTPQNSVLICETDGGRIGIKADLDNNGSYEAMLTKSGISEPVPGDMNGDGKITFYDAAWLNRYITEDYVGSIVVNCNPDYNGDGFVDIFDVIDMRNKINTK